MRNHVNGDAISTYQEELNSPMADGSNMAPFRFDFSLNTLIRGHVGRTQGKTTSHTRAATSRASLIRDTRRRTNSTSHFNVW